jgi:hypothetical protein
MIRHCPGVWPSLRPGISGSLRSGGRPAAKSGTSPMSCVGGDPQFCIDCIIAKILWNRSFFSCSVSSGFSESNSSQTSLMSSICFVYLFMSSADNWSLFSSKYWGYCRLRDNCFNCLGTALYGTVRLLTYLFD